MPFRIRYGNRDVARNFKCSSSMSLAGAKRRPGRDWGERYIEVASGGLVEFGGLSNQGRPIVQFMHQTVKQFVIGPWCKFQLLGNNIGMFVTENGHSFISKYFFVNSDFEDHFIHHAREPKMTTEFSQYDFFSTAPKHHDFFPYGVSSMAELAVVAGLQVCVNDTYEADRPCIRLNSAGILSLLLAAIKPTEYEEPIVTKKNIDETTSMARLLVAKGLSIDENSDGFVEIVRQLWTKEYFGAARCLVPEYESLAVVLVDAISRPSMSQKAARFQRTSS